MPITCFRGISYFPFITDVRRLQGRCGEDDPDDQGVKGGQPQGKISGTCYSRSGRSLTSVACHDDAPESLSYDDTSACRNPDRDEPVQASKDNR
jgi:hypothetical protein